MRPGEKTITIYGFCKRLYRRTLPRPWREAVRRGGGPFGKALLRVKGLLEGAGRYDELYDEGYYAGYEREWSKAAAIMADSVVRDLRAASVIDVGCGAGALLAALAGRGVACVGLERSEAAIRICRAKGIEVIRFDIEGADALEQTADVVVSIEVAEHLPASCADRFVKLLCEAADNVAMSAAPPGQGGTDHVNEQPPEYWIEKFEARGFTFREDLASRWKEEWRRKGVVFSCSRNLLVFGRYG